ncbi:MAG: Rpn family recombination-promoting nuclease/putative transposase [Polyangiales bacterium]
MTDTPHDALFRYAFSRPEVAAGELRALLPPELVRRADWSTLAPLPSGFVDHDLSNRACDLLFSVQLGSGTALVYVLFEHQSTRDPWTPLRLLRYQVRIWTQFQAEHPSARRLPPIVSVVLQHDPTSGAPPRSFAQLLDADDDLLGAVGPFVPDFRFVLEDLQEVDDDELKRRSMAALGRLVLWCLKHGRDVGEIAEQLEGWADVFREVRSTPHGLEAVGAVMSYIRRVNEQVPSERLENLLESVLDAEFREVYVTEGERLIEQGERRLLLRQLQIRFGELDDAVVARVEAASRDEFERWAERMVAGAPDTAEDVLA